MIRPKLLSPTDIRYLRGTRAPLDALRFQCRSRKPIYAQRSFVAPSSRPREEPAAQRGIQNGISSKTDRLESIKPETIHRRQEQAEKESFKADALLSEQVISNKEQRKADWAIMKEMSRYLWPKVRPDSTTS